MKCRALSWSVLLAVSAILIIVTRGSFAASGSAYTHNNTAADGGGTSRYKTEQIHTTQYVWDLVSGRDGHVICQVVVNHPNQPTNDETIQLCADQIFPPEPTPASGDPNAPRPTPVPFNLTEFFRSVFWRFVETRELVREVMIPLPEMIVNVTVPPDQSAPFIATISAYEPVYGYHITEISGSLNGRLFTCPSARCNVPVSRDSVLEFWARSSFGDESKHLQGVLQVLQKADHTQTLQLSSLNPVTVYQDSCALAWGLPMANLPSWAKLPATPDELNTAKPYQYLASKLINVGAVDSRDCPDGGVTSTGAPSACAVARLNEAVTNWQNQFDVILWESGRSLGVPPILLKTMIEQESQFWPGNARRAYYEYGLGQMNQSGADVALRWDNDLFNSICSTLLYDCSKIYGRLPSGLQATMRGGLMRSIDAQCDTCPHWIDLERASDSVSVFARTLRANCLQVRYILGKRGPISTYDDLWRFTFVSYHSGFQCLKEAIDRADYNQLPTDWDNVSPYLTCPGSQLYVEETWKSLESFDKFRLKPDGSQAVPLVTFEPLPATPTPPLPTSTPTPILALSHIRVQVYVDSNNNNYPEPQENVDGIQVTVTFPDGQVLSQNTTNGEAVFDLTGRPVGTDVVVALPQLYRTQKVRIIRDGELPVTFRLEQPVAPPVLP